MKKTIALIITIVLSTVISTTSGNVFAAAISNLMDPSFNASGDGHYIIKGEISAKSNILNVDDYSTWRKGQGIRIHAAGKSSDILSNTIICSNPTPSSGPVNLCEVKIKNPESYNFNKFDQLRIEIESTVNTASEDLQIITSNEWGNVEHGELEVNALTAGRMETIFVDIQGQNSVLPENPLNPRAPGISQVKSLKFRCNKNCSLINVRISNIALVQDHVTTVLSMDVKPGTLKAKFEIEIPAERTVTNAEVFHDDTVAIQNWVNQAQSLGYDLSPVHLWAPPGIYYISKKIALYSNTHIACEGDAVFKNTGRSKHGTLNMFVGLSTPTESIKDIKIEYCHFDANGWNRSDFLSFIAIKGSLEATKKAKNIVLQYNIFKDTNFPGDTNCDQGRKLPCQTLQRQYILVTYVEGAWVEHNELSHGGRIKIGRPGKRIYIQHNTLNFVNDNAITVVDRKKSRPFPQCNKFGNDVCTTEDVHIIGNTIVDPVAGGIFFGVDGEYDDHKQMVLNNVQIRDNQIVGFFSSAGIVGILPADTTNITISNNTVISYRERSKAKNTHQFGIAISSTNLGAGVKYAKDMHVFGNCIVARGKHANLDSGLFVKRYSERLNIFANTIYAQDGVIEYMGRDQLPSNLYLSAHHCISDRTRPIDYNLSGLIERGIHIKNPGSKSGLIGNYDYKFTNVNNNAVQHAGVALLVQASVKHGNILSNRFYDSTNSNRGQITIIPSKNPHEYYHSFDGSIINNYISNSNPSWDGYGIYCHLPKILARPIGANRITPSGIKEIHDNCKIH